jgi:hypothetical protein
MADRKAMETRPPVVIEAVVRTLLPPAAREHVLGDLTERYTSPRRYVVDALRTVPFVIASQVRRTTSLFWFLMPALIFMMAFAAGPADAFWIRGGIPTSAALIGLVLRDAYRRPDVSRPWRQGAVDIAVVTVCVLASQLVLAAMQPLWLVASGGGARLTVVLVILYLVRVQNSPASGLNPRCMASGPTMSLDGLRREVSMYQSATRRAVTIELAVGLFVVLFFTGFAVIAVDAPVLIRIGAVLGAAGALFVASRMWTVLTLPPIPVDGAFADTARSYRARLERQHHSLQTMWRWYGLPLSVGPMVVFTTAAATSSQPIFGVAGVVIAVIAVGVFLDRALFARQARSLRQRISTLETVTEDERPGP